MIQLKVKDIVDLKGCYSAHSVGELDVDLSKAIDVEKVKEKIIDCLSCDYMDIVLDMGSAADYMKASKYLMQSILTNLNQCLKDKP